MNRKLDRVVKFDERSRAYSIAAVLTDDAIRSYTWACDACNNQGQEGACVGFAWSHELSAKPAVTPVGATKAREIYTTAQKLDEWAGENYEGTSVLAGVKAVQQMFRNAKGAPAIAEYRWAFTLKDLVRALGYHGPAVLGINWYDGMFEPDAKGFVRRQGVVAGGHAILARGVKIVRKSDSLPRAWDNVDMDNSYVLLRNSWGRGWGTLGDCKISLMDLGALLREQGEACIPSVRNVL